MSRPYVKAQKNDDRDAEAIAEAATRPTMRFVTLKTAEQLETPRVNVRVAGRIMAIRLMGKAGFCHLQQDGKRLQIYVKKDAVGDKGFE